MSLGDQYRNNMAQKAREADAQAEIVRQRDTQELSTWFNAIAGKLPALMQQAVDATAGRNKDEPRLRWSYPGDFGDFRRYRGDDYKVTEGFKAFQQACKELDVDYECAINDSRDMCDDGIKELDIRVVPERRYDVDAHRPDVLGL